MSIKTWEKEFGKCDYARLVGLKPINLHKHEVRVLEGVMYGMLRVKHCYVPHHQRLFPKFQGFTFGSKLVADEEVMKAFAVWQIDCKTEALCKVVFSRIPLLLRIKLWLQY